MNFDFNAQRGGSTLESATPYISIYKKTLTKKMLFREDWFTVNINLVIQKPNNLYLLVNDYKHGWNGIYDEHDNAYYLGEANQIYFPQIQNKINNILKGKFTKIRFSIKEINEFNKKDNNYYVHATCEGLYENENVLYHHRMIFSNINELLKDKEEYEKEYEYFYRNQYIK